MLILTRRLGETIRIGDDVSITVLGISGQQVRLGITAPESVEVHREEIYQRIQAERLASVDTHQVNQIAHDVENVNQQQNAHQNIQEIIPELTTDISAATESMHIDDRVKMIGAEPAFLTVVFKLPSLNDARSLISQLPHGKKALGTEAELYGFSTGNLMEAEPCEQ